MKKVKIGLIGYSFLYTLTHQFNERVVVTFSNGFAEGGEVRRKGINGREKGLTVLAKDWLPHGDGRVGNARHRG